MKVSPAWRWKKGLMTFEIMVEEKKDAAFEKVKPHL